LRVSRAKINPFLHQTREKSREPRQEAKEEGKDEEAQGLLIRQRRYSYCFVLLHS
jgi:hypothetical protein